VIVNSETYKARLSKCGSCKHYNKTTRSCGTLLNRLHPNPDKATYRGKEIELCGCVMAVKGRLKIARCPIGKWGRDLTKYELSEVKRIVDTMGDGQSIGRDERKDFYKVYSMVYGRTKTDEKCKPCFNKELKEFVNDYKNGSN
jgi:hypothetical protein